MPLAQRRPQPVPGARAHRSPRLRGRRPDAAGPTTMLARLRRRASTCAARSGRSSLAPSRWSRSRGRSPSDHRVRDHGRADVVAGAHARSIGCSRRSTCCGAEGVAIVYVTHRLDEVFRICDTVTVLRDGRRVHTGPVAGLTRLELIALMLGRDDRRVLARITGFAERGRGRRSRCRPARRAGLDPAPRPRRRGRHRCTRGEVVGLAGLLGSGRSRDREGDLRGAAARRAAPCRSRAARSHRGSVPRPRSRRASRCIPEDRKAEGIVPGLSVRDNIALGILPSLARFGLRRRPRSRTRSRTTSSTRLQHQDVEPRTRASRELSGGNQQKVLARARCSRWSPRC